MDYAELAIEGAGLALVGTIATGLLAIAGHRQRLLCGITVGMGLALVVLPFIAYLVAWLTHHDAAVPDTRPPAYLVATALVCGGLCLAGVVAGILAEWRRPASPLTRLRKTGPEDDGNDDPHAWFPYGQRGWPRQERP